MANLVKMINEKKAVLEVKDDSIVASYLALLESSASSLTVQSALPVAKASLAKIAPERHTTVILQITNEKLTFEKPLSVFDKIIENHEFLLENCKFKKNEKTDTINKFAESLNGF